MRRGTSADLVGSVGWGGVRKGRKALILVSFVDEINCVINDRFPNSQFFQIVEICMWSAEVYSRLLSFIILVLPFPVFALNVKPGPKPVDTVSEGKAPRRALNTKHI